MTELQPYIDKAIEYGACGSAIKELKKYETIKEFTRYCKHAPEYCYWYAEWAIRGRFELGENIIAMSANLSYMYARYVLEDRFKLGEEAIATDACSSFCYAKYVLEDRFELGEKAIAENCCTLYWYNDFIERLGNDRITAIHR